MQGITVKIYKQIKLLTRNNTIETTGKGLAGKGFALVVNAVTALTSECKTRHSKAVFLLLFVILYGIFGCGCSRGGKLHGESLISEGENKTTIGLKPIFYRYHVERSFPHDTGAFTQGLVYQDGIFFESTGLYGESTLRKVEAKSGKVLLSHMLPRKFYGEGLAQVDGKLIQLTWKSRKGFVYDKSSFTLIEKFSYTTEGWGITHDGNRLIVSDGTSVLYFLDDSNFNEIGRLQVNDRGKPVALLNELEFVNGRIYANIWKEQKIAIISPASGRVEGWINLHGLFIPTGENTSENVLNGIAYDPREDRLFVTGKRWPRIFEIKIFPIKKNR